MKRLLIPLFSIALWWSAAAQDKAQSDGGWWNENPSLVLPIRAVGVTGVKPMKEIGVQKTQLDTLVLHENIALSMADVLTFNSSIFIKQYGRATLSTVAFRGTGPSHTQVVWNGMRINSPMLGMTDFSMIPSYFVDDAQLLHGTSSVNVTGGGLGGAVMLATKPAGTQGFGLQYTQGIGSFWTTDEFLRLTYGNDRWQTSTRVVYSSSPNEYSYRNHDKKENIYDDEHNIIGSYYPREKHDDGAFRDFHLLQEAYYNTGNGDRFGLNAWLIASKRGLGRMTTDYGDPKKFINEQRERTLRNVLRILALNLFFAAANIVPNALILKEKRFRFAAMRSLTVQIAGGTAAIAAAYAGAGIYALTINPVFSSLMLLAINYRQNPLPLRLRPGRKALGKVFSFSAYQFSFQLINYFSRNLDKLLMGRYMSLSQLGYYDKSYRLMMLPLQNIAYVISPVMHPIFSEMQHDLKQLGASYLKVVRLLAFIGLPLSAVLFFTAQELVLIIFGDQWEPSVPVFRILALSVGIQIVMSTSGSIFQAANATRMLFLCGVFSAALNVAAICTGIFAFGTTEAVAWCICASFAVNFVQCYHALFCLTLRTGWRPFWQNFLSPLLLTALVGLPLAAAGWLLPPMPLVASLTLKGTAALGVWLLYVHLSGEYDLKGLAYRLLARKNR